MSDLTAFLLARLDEDKLYARRTRRNGFTFDTPATAERLHRDAERALADIAAKRRIVARCAHAIEKYDGERIVELARETLVEVALPYASHPDYKPEWAA